MNLRRPFAALTACCTLLAAAPVAAQVSAAPTGPVDRPAALITPRAQLPDFRMAEGDLRRPGDPRRSGLIASVPLNRNVEIGLGRFRVTDTARPRTHTESDRTPGGMTPRERSIAGFGISLRFD